MNWNRQRLSLRGSSHRHLYCERLEDRSLLAAMIATAEIPPAPIDVVEDSTRAFIETALKNVMQASGEPPLRSSVSTESTVADDGQPLRITNVVVEFAQTPDVDTASPTPPTANTSLVFTFVVYADNSVSMRASLSRIDTAVPDLETMRWELNTALGDSLTQEEVGSAHTLAHLSEGIQGHTGDALEPRPGENSAPLEARLVNPHPDTSGEDQDEALRSSVRGWQHSDGLSDNSAMVADEAATAGMLHLAFGDDETEPESSEDSLRNTKPSSWEEASDATDGVEVSEKIASGSQLPVPVGMIAVDYVRSEDVVNNSSEVAPGRMLGSPLALFQVFVQSHPWQSDATSSKAPTSIGQARESMEEWNGIAEHPMLSVVAVVGGVWWTLQGRSRRWRPWTEAAGPWSKEQMPLQPSRYYDPGRRASNNWSRFRTASWDWVATFRVSGESPVWSYNS